MDRFCCNFRERESGRSKHDGKYTAELITSANAAEQIVNIEDIVASGEDNIAVVIQPIDDTVQSAIQQLVDAEIPYVAFDRIIDGVSSSAVSNVKVTMRESELQQQHTSYPKE